MALVHVAELARILLETGASVVVSSAWRHGGYLNQGSRLHDELAEKGEDGALVLSRIIGITPDLWREPGNIRGNEIQRWIDEHEYTGAFVIVDDDSDMGHLAPYLVQTSFETGLTREIADEIIRRLVDSGCAPQDSVA